jgi:hypothetical protein
LSEELTIPNPAARGSRCPRHQPQRFRRLSAARNVVLDANEDNTGIPTRKDKNGHAMQNLRFIHIRSAIFPQSSQSQFLGRSRVSKMQEVPDFVGRSGEI